MGFVADIQTEIQARSLLAGGWASGNSWQASVETTCYALLALSNCGGAARDNATDFLLRVRNPDGSWPSFDGDDPEGCWTTALALIALRFMNVRFTGIRRSLSWLLKNKGREGHWLWKWKFKTVDRAVQFNPDKFGCPWFPGTVSWIIPTAFALIALKQSLFCCRTAEMADRINLGMSMLRDRACPDGGWNAGNGIVFGNSLKPHIDTTALALLAMSDNGDPIAINGLNWLREAYIDCSAPYSLSWTALAMLRYRDGAVNSCIEKLQWALSESSAVSNVETLGVALIATNAARGNGNPFDTVI